VKIDIDSEYNISEFNKAWARYADKAKTGRVIVKVNGGW
jgi:hypothetical protein